MDMGGSSSSNSIERSVVLDYKPGNGDDGWYLVSVTPRDGKLGIHYERSPDKPDEVLDLADFGSPGHLYSKFRYPSIQLKDKDCEEVVPKRFVLVAYPLPAGPRDGLKEATSIPLGTRYFDARIVKIARFKHLRSHNEEKCMCVFDIEWIFGPYAGKTHYVYCENIHSYAIDNIEKHPIFTEATKFIKDTNTRKRISEDHLVGPGNQRKRSNMVIVEDDNGLIVCRGKDQI